MKKKLAIILLALGVLGMFTGCNKDKENKEESQQENQSTEASVVNKDGFVVAVDRKSVV